MVCALQKFLIYNSGIFKSANPLKSILVTGIITNNINKVSCIYSKKIIVISQQLYERSQLYIQHLLKIVTNVKSLRVFFCLLLVRAKSHKQMLHCQSPQRSKQHMYCHPQNIREYHALEFVPL